MYYYDFLAFSSLFEVKSFSSLLLGFCRVFCFCINGYNSHLINGYNSHLIRGDMDK